MFPVEILTQLPDPAVIRTEYIEKHRPVVLRKPCLSPFLPALGPLLGSTHDPDLRRLEELTQGVVVEVACSGKGESISGDLQHAQSARLALRSFLAFFRATSADGRSRGAFEEDLQDLELCLCQCPIYRRAKRRGPGSARSSSSSDSTQQQQEAASNQPPPACSPAPLACLWESGVIDIPPPLTAEELVSVNLWMSLSGGSTTLHYDSDHNLLVVLRGRKQVHLFSPEHTARLGARPMYSGSANHSTRPIDPAQRFEAGKGCLGGGEGGAMVALLEEGDALFIPEGFWHQVDSEARTLAVNFWFEGLVERLLQQEAEEELLPFVMRSVVQRAVAVQRRRAVQQALSSAAQACLEKGQVKREERETSAAAEEEAGQEAGKKRARHLEALDWGGMLREAMRRPPVVEGSAGKRQSLSAVEEVLIAMPMSVMLHVLPSVASEQPAEWTAALLATCPLAAESLTARWEEERGDEEEESQDMQTFFAAVLAGPDMDSEAVRQHLVGAKDALARHLAIDLLEGGSTGPPSQQI